MADDSSGMTIAAVRRRGFFVPLRFALGTSAAVVGQVPLLLVDVETKEGVTGHAYVFCYTRAGALAIAAILDEMGELVAGGDAAPGPVLARLSRRYALLGVTGTVRIALSALDMALWDALARARAQPLARVLGAAPRAVRAYDSRGLGILQPDDLAREAEAMLELGLGALKLRLGHATLQADLAAISAVRRAAGDDVPIMTDYNQALLPSEAIRRGLAIQDQGIEWLEEPIRADDLPGNARIAEALRVPLQLGENFNGPEDMRDALAARAGDYAMPDVSRIGGVTGWMQAAGLAAAAGMELSTHLMPEVCAHLLCASPTAHWLEYVDWADSILAEPLKIENGHALVDERPGSGVEWDEAKLRLLERIA